MIEPFQCPKDVLCMSYIRLQMLWGQTQWFLSYSTSLNTTVHSKNNETAYNLTYEGLVKTCTLVVRYTTKNLQNLFLLSSENYSPSWIFLFAFLMSCVIASSFFSSQTLQTRSGYTVMDVLNKLSNHSGNKEDISGR